MQTRFTAFYRGRRPDLGLNPGYQSHVASFLARHIHL